MFFLASSVACWAAWMPKFWRSAVWAHCSTSVGCGLFRGSSAPRAAIGWRTSPTISRRASQALLRVFSAAISPAAALSKAAWDSCTSVMAVRPTSNRCSAWSSWRLTARSLARANTSASMEVSVLK